MFTWRNWLPAILAASLNLGWTASAAGEEMPPLTAPAAEATAEAPWWSWNDMDREQKMIAVNTAGALGILGWGFLNWDYGDNSFTMSSEGWFGADTRYGGADKLGHFWSTYAAAQGLSYLYDRWGYDRDEASWLGALSSWGLMTLMEVGDGFSTHGFAYEDLVMNSVGAAASYALYKYPDLARKLDFRIEYDFSFNQPDIFTDYEHIKYLAAVKLDGFEATRSNPWQYLELHLGYYTRGYHDWWKDKERNLYFGVGLNISKLFKDRSYTKTSTLFRYLQLPYTYIAVEHNFDD